MARRLSSRPAIVCASSAPPVTGPATTSVCVDDRRRQDVEQILREAPDRRRVAEQLVRVQVDAAVIAVAEVEVPVEHQHFVLLQILRAPSRGSRPAATSYALSRRLRRCTNTGRPPTIVAATPPRSSQPSNGVFFDRDRSRAASIAHPQVRREDRDVGRRARRQRPARRRRGSAPDSPTAARPAAAAGSRPACTSRSSDSGTAVSRPTMPNGARSNSTFFSS